MEVKSSDLPTIWESFHRSFRYGRMSISTIESDNQFILGLEENAIDSLIHAVEHFIDDESPTNIKYSILHVFHAVELFLKARLAKINPDFIYKSESKEKTLYFYDLVKKLEKNGVSLSKEDQENLQHLKNIRNKIEHNRIEHDRDEIEQYIGCAFYFLECFLRKELDMSLKEELDKIDVNAYETLSMAFLFHLKRMSDSGISLNPKYSTDFSFHTCENCGEETVVIPDPRSYDSSTYCFCCFSRYEVNYCPMCESSYLDSCSIDTSATEINNSTDSNNDMSSEEEEWPSHYGFCDNCQDRISSS